MVMKKESQVKFYCKVNRFRLRPYENQCLGEQK